MKTSSFYAQRINSGSVYTRKTKSIDKSLAYLFMQSGNPDFTSVLLLSNVNKCRKFPHARGIFRKEDKRDCAMAIFKIGNLEPWNSGTGEQGDLANSAGHVVWRSQCSGRFLIGQAIHRVGVLIAYKYCVSDYSKVSKLCFCCLKFSMHCADSARPVVV